MQSPQVFPTFGDYLRKIREDREGLSLRAVIIRLARLGIPADPATISRYERGKRERLDPLILWGLGEVYGEPIERLIAELAQRSKLKVAELPATRLTESEELERKVMRLFRRAPASVQREIAELLEFKSQRKKGEKGGTEPPQPKTAAGARKAPRAR